MKMPHIDLVKEMVDLGYINVRKHPEFDLYIYNYSKLAEFEHKWNDATELCRGIICDKDMNVVARPFTKFYLYEEIVDKSIIPDLPFEVYEKLDGSLGILYFYDGKPYIATRGSFESEQAKHATDLLYTKYKDNLHLLDQSKTYLFEIIYKDNNSPLVVDYGDTDDIFLIGVIDIETGIESDIYDYKHIFKTTTKYEHVKDYLNYRDESDGKNREGFVIKFSNGFRMKLKFAEYFELHSLVSHLTDKAVVDAMLTGTIDQLKQRILGLSEEAQIYFCKLVEDLTAKYKQIEDKCKSEYKYKEFLSEKEMAQYFLTCKYNAVLFAMKNKKDYSKIIWKIIKNDLSKCK